MRKYIRHPSDIPVDFHVENLQVGEREQLKDVSVGGLSFQSNTRVKVGEIIEIVINAVQPSFRARGKVTWCHGRKDVFQVGVEFVDVEDAFRARMVEQICHIEHYKKQVLTTEGRALSGEEAALEWIGKYAASFPELEIHSAKLTNH